MGSYAFANCKNLKKVVIGKNVVSIGYAAMGKDSAVQNLTVPFFGGKGYGESDRHLGYIFGARTYGGTSYSDNITPQTLKNLTVLNGEIGNNAVRDTIHLESVVLEDGVTNIGSYAFSGCSELASIIIPDNITSIRSSTFEGCASLTNITIPNSVTSIGDYAFNNRIILASITIPENVTSICEYAFLKCTSLTSVSLRNGVTSIGYYAFKGCSSLTIISIPDGVTSIGDNAFQSCSSLTTLTLPNSLRTIGSYAFSACPSLSISYDGDPYEWRHVRKQTDWNSGISISEPVYLKQFNGLLYDADDALENFWVSGYRLPEGGDGKADMPVRYSGRPIPLIYDNAFDGCTELREITISESVEKIGKYAFRNCSSLTKIVFPDSVAEIEKGILQGCTNLSELELSFLGKTKEYDYKVESSGGSEVITYGGEYLGYYFGAESYSEHKIVIPQSLETVTIRNGEQLAPNCFYACETLKTINLPSNLKNIEDRTFSGCIGLTSFTIPDSVTSVGFAILENCNNIVTVHIGKGLKTIGDTTIAAPALMNPLFGFDKSRSSLKSYTVSPENGYYTVDEKGILYRYLTVDGSKIPVAVVDAPAALNLDGYTMPETIVDIYAYAFAYNSTLRTIDLNYVRRIANHAFYKADRLVYVSLIGGDGAYNETYNTKLNSAIDDTYSSELRYYQAIGDSAFMVCTSLVGVEVLADNILKIGDLAFADCPELLTVEIGKNVSEIGLSAFGATDSGDSNPEKFIVSDENAFYKAVDGVLYSVNSDGTYTLEMFPAMLIKTGETALREYVEEFQIPNVVSAIQSYAFRGAKKLKSLSIAPDGDIIIGDYAFAGSMIENIFLGENVTSVGITRGESEYTVFSATDYLTYIEVDDENRYYSSENGVLFDKGKTKLIKYPTAKVGESYAVPSTVKIISSMAFKGNRNIINVTVSSDLSVIGLEAFYACSNLGTIYFYRCYAPLSILENALTTENRLEDGSISDDPETVLGYNADYYKDGANGEAGWNSYEGIYNIKVLTEAPEIVTVDPTNRYYSVVVVDTKGTKLGNMTVSLTDPNGLTETVKTDNSNLGTGIAVFFDLYDAEGAGFSFDYELPYKLTVSDDRGNYITFSNPSIYLDGDMYTTYITLTKLPSAYGLNCNGIDMNTSVSRSTRQSSATRGPRTTTTPKALKLMKTATA